MIEHTQDDQLEDKKQNLRYLFYHGKDDDLILEANAAKSYEKLKAFGFKNIEYRSEEFLGHSVSPSEVKLIREFLSKVMTC